MFLGIDFGTSYSQVATMQMGLPMLLLPHGVYGIPSEFYYDDEVGQLIGQAALDAGQGFDADKLVSQVKMRLLQMFELDGRQFSSEDIVRAIYQYLVVYAQQTAARNFITEDLEGVVLSVPANFTLQEKDIIYSAASSCMGTSSVPILAMIKEPVAAALAYFKSPHPDKKCILVYDLGGGTCDVALVRADETKREQYDVIDSDMIRIGGRDWDKVLEKYIIEELGKQFVARKMDVALLQNSGTLEKIRRTAIFMKEQLSDLSRERVTGRIEVNGNVFSVRVSRTTFEDISAQLLSETISCLSRMYLKHKDTNDITDIICVGGSSNMPQVESAIRKALPQCNVRIYKPEYAVVNGAAVYADLLGNKTGRVLDFVNYSYGIAMSRRTTSRNYIENIIIKSDIIPVEAEKTFRFNKNIKCVKFQVYESTYEDLIYDYSAPDKAHIGTLELRLPNVNAVPFDIICTMSIRDYGILEIEACDSDGHKVDAIFRTFKVNN